MTNEDTAAALQSKDPRYGLVVSIKGEDRKMFRDGLPVAGDPDQAAIDEVAEFLAEEKVRSRSNPDPLIAVRAIVAAARTLDVLVRVGFPRLQPALHLMQSGVEDLRRLYCRELTRRLTKSPNHRPRSVCDCCRGSCMRGVGQPTKKTPMLRRRPRSAREQCNDRPRPWQPPCVPLCSRQEPAHSPLARRRAADRAKAVVAIGRRSYRRSIRCDRHRSSRAQLARSQSPSLANTSPRDAQRGWHFLTLPGGLSGSNDDRIAPGVDVRANGNYVIWWPRQCKQVIDAPLAPWPEELLAKAKSKAKLRSAGEEEETPTFGFRIRVSPHSREGRYAAAALRNAFGKLAGWPRVAGRWQSGRNTMLNKLGFKMGGLVANGWIDEALVVRVLMLAAVECGLVGDDGEARCLATIHSGLSAGMQFPYPQLGPRYASGHV